MMTQISSAYMLNRMKPLIISIELRWRDLRGHVNYILSLLNIVWYVECRSQTYPYSTVTCAEIMCWWLSRPCNVLLVITVYGDRGASGHNCDNSTTSIESLSSNTPSHQISWYLEATRYGFSVVRPLENWQSPRRNCCLHGHLWNSIAIL